MSRIRTQPLPVSGLVLGFLVFPFGWSGSGSSSSLEALPVLFSAFIMHASP